MRARQRHCCFLESRRRGTIAAPVALIGTGCDWAAKSFRSKHRTNSVNPAGVILFGLHRCGHSGIFPRLVSLDSYTIPTNSLPIEVCEPLMEPSPQ